MSTKSRILAKSLELFNARGARAIGTTQICEALGMSPGNLYYHYKNREEIVLALFDALEPEFEGMLLADRDPPMSAQRFTRFYTESFRVLWKYRFFFGALVDLLQRDETLRERYRAFQARMLAHLTEIAGQFVKDGSMTKPPGPEGLEFVALNTWLIWMGWVRFLQTTKADDAITQGDLARGALLIYDILKPYILPSFREETERVLYEKAQETALQI